MRIIIFKKMRIIQKKFKVKKNSWKETVIVNKIKMIQNMNMYVLQQMMTIFKELWQNSY